MHEKLQAARDIVSVQAGGSGIEQAGDASPFLFQPIQKRTKEHYLNVIGEEDYLNNADKINFEVHSCTVENQQLAVEAAGAPAPPWFQLPPPKGFEVPTFSDHIVTRWSLWFDRATHAWRSTPIANLQVEPV